ncbi:hypothetical protein IAT40_005330 [Kwoniella sp. CBS 6097]
MSARTSLRSHAGFNPIALPSSSTPQHVNDDGYEYDPTAVDGEGPLDSTVEIVQNEEEVMDGGDDVEAVDEEVQADEDVEMEDAEDEVEDADEEEEEAAPEPFLTVKDSLVLPYSLSQTRQHHLTSLLPHIFTHPPIPSHSKPRARPPPKGTFIFPTPLTLVHPLPAREYHGPVRIAESSSPGPSTSTPQAQAQAQAKKLQVDQTDPSSSTLKGRSRPRKEPYPDQIQPPAHEIECISRCTLSVGPISFPGAEIWIGKFVEPRITLPKKERARPAERKEKRKSTLVDDSAAKKTPRPRPSTDGTLKKRDKVTKPKPRHSVPSPLAATTPVPTVRPAPTAPLHARPPGVRPPPGPTIAPGPKPPRPPGGAPSGRPTASPQLIQLVNQAASRAPWLSALIYKAAGSTANAEELERLGKAVARLSRGEPIEDLAPPGAEAVIAPAPTPVGAPGPSTMSRARPPATSGTVARPPGAIPSAVRPPSGAPVAPPVRPNTQNLASTSSVPPAAPKANSAISAPVSSTTAPGVAANEATPSSPAPASVINSTSAQPTPPTHTPTQSTAIGPPVGLTSTSPTPSGAAAAQSTPETEVTVPAPVAGALADPVTTERSNKADEPGLDDEVDMTGPKQVGGGPLPAEAEISAVQSEGTSAGIDPPPTAQSDLDAPTQTQTPSSSGLLDPSLPAAEPPTKSYVPVESSQAVPGAPDTLPTAPKPIVVPFAEPSVVVPPSIAPATSMPPPSIIPTSHSDSSRDVAPISHQPRHLISSNTPTVPASPSPLARAPSPTPPPPPPPKPKYPLPPPFILIAFKEQATEKYLIPLGQNSFISRVGGDYVTGPPPAPEPSPKPEPVPNPVTQLESTPITSDTQAKPKLQVSTPTVQGEPTASSSIAPAPAADLVAENPGSAIPLRNIKPLRSRTRQSLGRGAKEPPPMVSTASTATSPPTASTIETAEPDVFPEPVEMPPKPRPLSGLPPLPGMQPSPGTVLISTFVPSGESRWEKVDWDKLSQRLPFENPELWERDKEESAVKVEPKDDVENATPSQVTTPSKVRPSRKSSNDVDKPKNNAKDQLESLKPDILNLGGEVFLPSSGDLQPLTIRLSDVEDSVWKRIRDVAEEVERAEIEMMFKKEPTLLEGLIDPDEDDKLNAPIHVSEDQIGSSGTPVIPETATSTRTDDPSTRSVSAIPDTKNQTPVPQDQKALVSRSKGATLSHKVLSTLRPIYASRKKTRFTSLLSRVPARSFLRTRLRPPPPQDLVDATTDKWAPRPYPISTKPLYVVAPDGEGEDEAVNREIESSPEPKNQRKRKANEKEETVTFEMPVSLEALDERVEEGAKRGIGRRGRGGRMSFGRTAVTGVNTAVTEGTGDDGAKKKKGKRGTEKGTCEGCAREGIKVWRKGPSGRGTLCNACGDLYVAGRLGPLKAPGAMKPLLGDGDIGADRGDGEDEEDEEAPAQNDDEGKEPENKPEAHEQQDGEDSPSGIETLATGKLDEEEAAAADTGDRSDLTAPPIIAAKKDGDKTAHDTGDLTNPSSKDSESVQDVESITQPSGEIDAPIPAQGESAVLGKDASTNPPTSAMVGETISESASNPTPRHTVSQDDVLETELTEPAVEDADVPPVVTDVAAVAEAMEVDP